MANKILKGIMKWLKNGETIKDNIATEISVPEEYFGATTELDNLNIGTDADNGKFLTKNGNGIALVESSGGDTLSDREREIIDSGGSYGVAIWDSDVSYPKNALVSYLGDDKELVFYQSIAANKGVIPEGNDQIWQMAVFTAIFPDEISVDIDNQG